MIEEVKSVVLKFAKDWGYKPVDFKTWGEFELELGFEKEDSYVFVYYLPGGLLRVESTYHNVNMYILPASTKQLKSALYYFYETTCALKDFDKDGV